MKQLRTTQEVDEALTAETAILFKHSTRCPISAGARGEMERFVERNPDAPVYTVDVLADAEASRHLAERTGIQHQSPQVILARGGEAAWHASHFDIRAEAVERQVGDD
jgi:bacillithiol system protein YtxJ